MSGMSNAARVALCALGWLLVPSSAVAHDQSTGGVGEPEPPRVDRLQCASGAMGKCPGGQLLKLRGEGLDDVHSVVFLGGKGRRDDRRARPRHTAPHQITVTVPRAARSGPVRAETAEAKARAASRLIVPAQAPASTTETTATPTAAPAPAAPAPGGHVFPIAGPHDLGQGPANAFGGGRGHGGQDMFAACGTPLVAATAGTVSNVAFQARAGNYLVITGEDGRSYVYMHMAAAATVAVGQRVAAGQPVGAVGETGRASGCHLHFELWTAPGWYKGGAAIDPLPELTAWDAVAGPH